MRGIFLACCAPARERPRGRAAERGYQFPPSDSDWHVALPCEGWKGTISHRKSAVLRFEALGNRVDVPAVHVWRRAEMRPGGPTCDTKPDPVCRRGIDD
jgi:hypothetical protein